MISDDTAEEWRTIEGWPDYEVSSLGRVRRCVSFMMRHWRDGSLFAMRPAGRFLTASTDKNGYLHVTLARQGEHWHPSIARLVCEAFHGPSPSSEHEVAHGDAVRTNNTSTNLAWKTRKENGEDKVRHGNSLRGRKHYKNKLSEDQVRDIRAMLNARELALIIANKHEISKGTVQHIKHKRSWAWLD